MAARLPVLRIEQRNAAIARGCVLVVSSFRDMHELRGTRKRQWTQHYLIHHGEHGGRSTNAERKRKHCSRREARVAPQLAQCVTKIAADFHSLPLLTPIARLAWVRWTRHAVPATEQPPLH